MNTYLIDYAYFTKKHELDEALKKHRSTNWTKMNDTDHDVLGMIRSHSSNFGVAHLKHSTIEKGIGKSNSTVRRSLRKLNQLGIIDRIHYIRPLMTGLGPNIYAIKTY